MNAAERYEQAYSRWDETDWTTGEVGAAAEAARELISMGPREPSAWAALATTLMYALLPPTALATTGDGEAPHLLGDPRFEEMIGAFGQVGALDPADVSSSWNSAIMLSRAGDFGRARDSYLEAARREACNPEPDYPERAAMVYALAAVAAYNAGDEEGAASAVSLARSRLAAGDDEDNLVGGLLEDVEGWIRGELAQV